MKFLFSTLLLSFSLTSFASEICFDDIRPFTDTEGELVEGVFKATAKEESFTVALSFVRCRCLVNETTSSINHFLKQLKHYDLNGRQICLIEPHILNNNVSMAKGFYLKEVQ